MGRTAKPKTREPKLTLAETLANEFEDAVRTSIEVAAQRGSSDIDDAKSRHRADQEMWRRRAAYLLLIGEDEDAARASAQAQKADDLLVKAAKADIVAKVEKLEERADRAKRRSKGIREAARKRKKADDGAEGASEP